MNSRVVVYLSKRNLQVFIACLLTFSMTMLPFVQISLAMSAVERRAPVNRESASQTSGVTETHRYNVNEPMPAPAPAPFAPVITATKTDALINDDGDSKADPDNGNPGTTEKIEYTVTVSNTGTTDATNVTFTDTIDTHTTLVAGSITTQPIAVNDTFSALGNVRIQVPDGASDLLNNDCDPDPGGGPCTNAGLTVSVLGGDNSAPFAGTSTQGGQVTATTGDGSFQYNPAPGFEGSDSFTYTVTDATGKTDTATVNLTVSGMIWFVNAGAGGGGDGRLTTPFNCLVGAGCFSGTTLDEPGDFIFLFSGTYNDTAALVLLNNQKLIGAAATAPLAGPGSITGFTVPPHSDALPATGGASPVINSSASGIQLASGNLLRGFTVGNTATTAGNYDILNTAAATVGTLNILEVILNGTGGLFRADSGGTLNVTFPTATTTSAGSNGFHIAGATSGSVTTSGGAISGVAGIDVLINGGTVSLGCASSITHTANTAMVDIANHTTGTVTFTAALSATNGTGLQFTNADSTTSYNFNGTTSLNGGDAGIDITGGSAGTFNFNSGTSINNPSGIAYREDTSTANVTYSGTITKNNNANIAIDINAKTGGTTAFSGAITASTTTATAIDLTNTGGIVNFTGGLNLTTTSGIGFNASGAGATVSATQNNTSIVNTITSGTGTALNVSSTTIGASGITFRSISANGGANGIVLSNTGSSGGLTITGNSSGLCGGQVSGSPLSITTAPVTADCTGGRIQLTTGADGATAGVGISLTNTQNVSLTRMRLDNHSNFAIKGSSVTALTLSNVLIDGVNGSTNSPDEGSINITNLLGTSTMTNSTVRGGFEDNISILNNTGTGTFTITGSTIRDNSTTTGNDGVFGQADPGATFTLKVINSVLQRHRGDHVNTTQSGNGVINTVVTGNTMTFNGTIGQPFDLATTAGGSITLTTGANFTGTSTFNVSNNNITGAKTTPININNTALTSTLTGIFSGTINNNIVGLTGAVGSGSDGDGIDVTANGNANITVTITNNNVRQWKLLGINLVPRDGAATLNATVQGNQVGEPSNTTESLQAILLNAGPATTETGNTCANIGGSVAGQPNSFPGTFTAGIQPIRVRQRAVNTVFLPGYTGMPFNTAQVVAYLSGRNGGAGATATANNVAGAGGFLNTPGGAPCTAGATPSLVDTSDEVAAQPKTSDDSSNADAVATTTASATSTEVSQPSIWMRAINAIAEFASGVHSLVEPTAYASDAAPRIETPTDVFEKRNQRSQLESQRDRVQKRDIGNRKTTLRNHAVLTPRAVTAPMAGETVTVVIGTLRPGDSVTITFQVTVNNPPNLTGVPPGPAQVSNQGTVNFNDGATPLSVNTNTETTPVDLFDTTTTLVSDVNPSNFGDLVTFTATVAENPTQASADPTGTVDFIDTSNGNAVICNDVALSSGSAQCQTSTLTAGTHNIRADYSGDGNFDPSQSNEVAQVVIACTPNPIVTSTADSGAGTLREAIASVCSGTTITFNIAGPGPHTITLTTGELPVTKNVTINNNSGESITVSGNNASRVFNINSGKTAVIIGLTMTGGSTTGNGGAVLNDGTLTIVNSTLSGNTAATDGGAISTTTTSLTLINTTISGNTAGGSGGGVIVLGGMMTSINTTITNNTADFDSNGAGDGGGIRAHAGTTTLKNTIVAGNLNENTPSADTADDISGTVDPASSFNLIGTGGSGGLTDGANDNQVGVANAGLGALVNNGGTTATHALLSTSTAVDAGSDANLPADTFDLDGDADTAEPLPVDQRGTGFPRVIGSSVDVGAFELGQADLSITKTDGSATETPGTSVTYTIVVSNAGPSAVIGATVADTFPAALTGVTFTSVAAGGATGNTAAGSGNINDTVNMPSGSSITYTVSATVSPSATGTLSNTATVTAPTSVVDPNLANNSATDTDTLGPEADLSITKTDGAATEIPGTSITYTIVVTNNGPSNANGATVADTFPAALTGVTFTSVAAGGATGNMAAGSGNISDMLNMPGGSSVTYTVNATIASSATGTLSNTATVTAPGGVSDPTPGNNSGTDTDTLTPQADLSITKTDGASTEVPGSSISYTIVVSNSGPSDVTGATVADTFPASLTGVSFTSAAAGGATGNTAAGSGNINDTVNMPAGSSITYTVNATIASSATGSLSNTATVTAPGGVSDPTPGNNSATDTDTLTPSADVSVTKTDSPDPVQSGENITFTITVTNNGSSDAQSLSLSDAVPANTTFVSVTTPAGWTRTDSVSAGGTGTVTFTRPTLAAGASSTFTLVVNVNGGTANGTTISNTATVSSTTADPTPGNNSATATTLVSNQPNVSVQDASVPEPSSGTVNMLFTVTLSSPAPAGGASVQYMTANGTANGGASCGGTTDYVSVALTTLNFAVGEQFKTISVTVCSDSDNAEPNETLLVNLSNPTNAIIVDGTATGTILVANQPGAILISELRTSGPGGEGDDFVEIYNNSDSPHVVNGTGGGYGLFKMGATCSDTPVLIGVIPNGTTIPGRGHFLFTGSAYSLANYGGTGAAAGDVTLSSDIESDRNVALFSTASLGGISSANRLDAVGFGAINGGICDLFREGAALTPLSGSTLEYSYFRDECGKKGNPATFGPCPTSGLVKDSNVNSDDFIFADTNITATPAGQRLGAPGPQNLGSPRTNFNFAALLLDATKGSAAVPNRVRDTSAIGPNAAAGTMSIRRRFVNNTGAPVTKLRIRVVDISTAFISPGGIADLRLLTSSDVPSVSVDDAATCAAAGFPSTPCNITVRGTTLETPPAQPNGGGLNSSMTTITITLGTPLAAGASVNLQLLLGVQNAGSFKFFFNIEALP